MQPAVFFDMQLPPRKKDDDSPAVLVEFVSIPMDGKDRVHRVATPEDRETYTGAYAAFKESQAAVVRAVASRPASAAPAEAVLVPDAPPVAGAAATVDPQEPVRPAFFGKKRKG